MTAPLIPPLAFAPLRAMAEAGLTDTVTLESLSVTQNDGGQLVEVWVDRDPEPCLYKALSLESPMRADQPNAMHRGTLAVKSGTQIAEGERGLVRGTTKGIAWQRLVQVEEVLHPKPHEIRRRALCVDVDVGL